MSVPVGQTVTGVDILIGGTGNDTYQVGLGYGAETIQENDATADNIDVLQFLSGIAVDQLWLRQVSNNLEVSIIGTSVCTPVMPEGDCG